MKQFKIFLVTMLVVFSFITNSFATITSLPARNEYTATAGQTTFFYTFKIFEDTDILVYVTPSGQAADDSTDIVTPSNVGGEGDEDGGTVTIAATSAGDLVTLVSNIPSNREVNYRYNGDFRPTVVNADFDRVVSLTKQVEDIASRTLVSEKSQQNAVQLSLPVPDAGLYMRWKSDETGLENTGAPSVTAPAISHPSVLDMQGSTTLVIGDVVQTVAYYTTQDGGAGLYEIFAAGTGTDDGGSYIDLSGSGTQAKLIIDSNINIRHYGAKGDGVTDDTDAINNMKSVLGYSKITAGTYIVSSTVLIEANQDIYLEANTTVKGAIGTIFRFSGTSGSLVGQGKSSIVQTTTASPNGVILLGHDNTTDNTAIQYNLLDNLLIRGADGFGDSSAQDGKYTVGLMLFNSQAFNSSGIVYYNRVTNIRIEDVKDGCVLTATVNANIFDNITFWRCGQTAWYNFSMYSTDLWGTRYGYDWDLATRNSGSVENAIGTVFVDSSFAAYNDPTYKDELFDDGQPYAQEGACLRMDGHPSGQMFTSFNAEPAWGTGYQIAAGVVSSRIVGFWNVGGSVNLSSDDVTVIQGHFSALTTATIQDAQIYDQTLMTAGTSGAPTLKDRFDNTTGLYFPAAGEMGFSTDANEKVLLGGSLWDVYLQGSVGISGDLRPKAIYPDGDNVRTNGTASYRWSVVYSAGGVLTTSDEREKQQIEQLSDAEKRVAVKLKANIKKFKFNNDVEKNGINAKIHIGVVAQEIVLIFESEGLNALDYGLISLDSWEDIKNKEGSIVKEAGSLYGIRYNELLSFIIAAI